MNYKEQYLGDFHTRTLTTSLGSFTINALIGIGKLILGIVLLSPWFIVTAIYYLLLCAARGQILKKYKDSKVITNSILRFELQFNVFHRSGIFICLIGISYFFICLRMYFYGESTTYPDYILYGVAAVAFYKIGIAIYGVIVTKRMKNPLLTTLKFISFIDSCVSIVAVQCALLTMEGSSLATSSSALLGASCSVIFLGIGVFMVCINKDSLKEMLN